MLVKALHEAMVVHLHGARNMILSNQELVSPIMMIVFFSNFTINIYGITMLLFKPMTTDQQAIATLGICVQMLFLCLGVQPIIRSANMLHYIAPILCTVQPLLPSFVLRTKLQVLTYYEINHASGENKFTFTLGPLGKITNTSLFEVVLRS